MTATKQSSKLRREALEQIGELSYRWASLTRRIHPGHSSSYVPGPADEADRIMRDAPSAYSEREAVRASMLALARTAREHGATVDQINAAADPAPRLCWSVDTEWDARNEPINYRVEFAAE